MGRKKQSTREIQIKICPFCSHQPRLITMNHLSGDSAVYCGHCHAMGHIGTPEEALAAWNQRPPEPEPDELRKRITDWIFNLDNAPYQSSEQYAATILKSLI